jgi:hypothetical protein
VDQTVDDVDERVADRHIIFEDHPDAAVGDILGERRQVSGSCRATSSRATCAKSAPASRSPYWEGAERQIG